MNDLTYKYRLSDIYHYFIYGKQLCISPTKFTRKRQACDIPPNARYCNEKQAFDLVASVLIDKTSKLEILKFGKQNQDEISQILNEIRSKVQIAYSGDLPKFDKVIPGRKLIQEITAIVGSCPPRSFMYSTGKKLTALYAKPGETFEYSTLANYRAETANLYLCEFRRYLLDKTEIVKNFENEFTVIPDLR